MKRALLTTFFNLLFCLCIQAQTTDEFEKPEIVSEESKEELVESKIFIPIEINQAMFKEMIDASTPEKLKSKVTSDVRDLNIGFKVKSGETKFGKNEINHALILDKEFAIYKSRKKNIKSWPFKGVKFTDWNQVECIEMEGSGSANMLLKLNKDCLFAPVIEIVTDVDKLMCDKNNMAGLATLMSYQEYKNVLKANLTTELKKVDLKNNITTTWDNLQTPTPISKELFLTKKATNINFKQLRFEEALGKMNVGLTFSVSASKITKETPAAEKTALPDLLKNSEKSKPNFAINLPITYYFKDLKEKLKGKFTGQVLKGKTADGKNKKFAKVADVDFLGSEESEYDFIIKLSSKLTKKSDVEQIIPIYLQAKLAFDTIQKSLFIKQFKIDDVSKKVLEKYEAQPIISKTTYTKMLLKFQLKINDLIDNQKKITKSLKQMKLDLSNGISLTNVGTALELNKVTAQPDRLFCLFILKGETKAEVLKVEKLSLEKK